MIAAHRDAVQARLEARFPGKVFDTARLDPDGEFVRDNYLILFAGSPVETGGDRQVYAQVVDDNAVFDYTVRVVATSASVALDMLDAVHIELLGWTPTIPGRRCQRLHYPRQNPRVQTENSVKPPLFWVDTEWVLRSNFVAGGS